MHGGKKAPDIGDILPSVRARGIIVPLIVRARENETFEIVAGRRRYHAARAIVEEAGSIDPLPCAVIEQGDDAAALEASLIENLVRLDPDEVARWENFTRLVKEGRTPDDIAATFGLTALQVKRTLALGNLHPRIRSLYRAAKIDAVTMRHLTLASPKQQKAWLALVDCPEKHAPTGSQLKAWLFGGASIATNVALFDLADYPGEIASDLFGDDNYFADAETFWTAQNAAIEAKRSAYLQAGWADAAVLGVGEYFQTWEYERVTKAKGGKVFIAVTHRGEVAFHEGWLSTKEIKRAVKGEAPKAVRAEVTAALDNYVDLHRHAAVRAALAARGDVALRLMVAHAICGSGLWQVKVDPQRAASDAIAESIENSHAEAMFDERRRAALALLGFDPEAPVVTGGYDGEDGMTGLFAKLLELSDDDMHALLAIVMGETLACGSVEVEAVGHIIGVDMRGPWEADDAFLDLIRDREVLTAMIAELAGDVVARANEKATAKVLRSIVRDCLTGSNGRVKAENWLPKWLAFPPASYTARGGAGCVSKAARVATVFAPSRLEAIEREAA